MIEFEIREAREGDEEELFALYALVVEEGSAFPAAAPATREDFERTWMRGQDDRAGGARSVTASPARTT